MTDMPRERLARHPWTLSVGADARLLAIIDERSPRRLSELPFVKGVHAGNASGADEIFVMPPSVSKRFGLEDTVVWPYLTAETLADEAGRSMAALYPYDQETGALLVPDREPRWWRFLWRYRAALRERAQADKEGNWWAWSRARPLTPSGAPRLLSSHMASTHRFILEEGRATIGRSLWQIELAPHASKEDVFVLLAYLNSSLVSYWLKKTSPEKSLPDSEERSRHRVYEFGPRLRDIPIPQGLLAPGAFRDDLASLGQSLNRNAREYAACAPDCILAQWDRTSRDALVEALADAQLRELGALRRMVADQEDVDWLVYAACGLVEGPVQRTPGSALPEHRPFAWRSEEPPSGMDSRLVETWQQRRATVERSPGLSLVEVPSHKRPFHRLDYRVRIAAASETWLLEPTVPASVTATRLDAG